MLVLLLYRFSRAVAFGGMSASDIGLSIIRIERYAVCWRSEWIQYRGFCVDFGSDWCVEFFRLCFAWTWLWFLALSLLPDDNVRFSSWWSTAKIVEITNRKYFTTLYHSSVAQQARCFDNESSCVLAYAHWQFVCDEKWANTCRLVGWQRRPTEIECADTLCVSICTKTMSVVKRGRTHVDWLATNVDQRQANAPPHRECADAQNRELWMETTLACWLNSFLGEWGSCFCYHFIALRLAVCPLPLNVKAGFPFRISAHVRTKFEQYLQKFATAN